MALVRSRWAAIGAAVAVTLGAGGVSLSQAAIGEGERPVYVSLPSPCRVVDTRPASNVGPKSTPIGAGETNAYTIQITGANGDCTGPLAIPTDALAISLNLTAINPTTNSNFRVYPADAPFPTTSNLNFGIGRAPTANKVDVGLSPNGRIKLANAQGTADAAIDIFGYYIDHTHDDLEKRLSPDGVIWVAQDGTGDFASLSAALASITDASPTNPYLIRIAPGIYDINAPIIAKDHVNIEGSGERITTIRCNTACSASAPGRSAAVLDLSATTEVRHLGIENRSIANTYTFGVFASGPDVASLLHVTVASFGQSAAYGIWIEDTPTILSNVTATATAGTEVTAISLIDSAATMTDVNASAIDGSYNYAITNYNSSPTMTDVTATATATDGSTNVGVANTTNSSPNMNNVTATASMGQESYGVTNSFNSSPRMNNVTANAYGAGTTIGIENTEQSFPVMVGVTSIANDGATAYGIANYSNSSPRLTSATAIGVTGTGIGAGIYNAATAAPEIIGSYLYGNTNSIRNNGGTARVADSTLDGAVTGGGFTCIGVHNASFAALNAGCV